MSTHIPPMPPNSRKPSAKALATWLESQPLFLAAQRGIPMHAAPIKAVYDPATNAAGYERINTHDKALHVRVLVGAEHFPGEYLSLYEHLTIDGTPDRGARAIKAALAAAERWDLAVEGAANNYTIRTAAGELQHRGTFASCLAWAAARYNPPKQLEDF